MLFQSLQSGPQFFVFDSMQYIFRFVYRNGGRIGAGGERLKRDENLSQKMREAIDKPRYRKLYSRRLQIIEPVFADITYCKGMGRFTMRGREKVNIQWKLYCILHNIGKWGMAKREKLAG